MKKIEYTLLIGVVAFALASCLQIDNWPEPDTHLTGVVIDATTNQPMLLSHPSGNIRIWERSFSERFPERPPHTIGSQDIPIQGEGGPLGTGRFNNTKLFPGRYDMLPVGLAVWASPSDTIRNVELRRGRVNEQNFRVYPLMRIVDFNAGVVPTNDSIWMSMRIYVPAYERELMMWVGDDDGGDFFPTTVTMPPLNEIHGWLSFNSAMLGHVGGGERFLFRWPTGMISWEQIDTDGDGLSDATLTSAQIMPAVARAYTSVVDGLFTITQPIPERMRGQDFYVRMGARAYPTTPMPPGGHNVSEIRRVFVPR